jgi:hypothetical protein
MNNMKIWKYIFPCFLLLSLSGCFDIDEEINVKNNGSGQMNINMDMSQLLDIMQTYVGKDEMGKQMPKDKMDTTIYMKDLVDTAKDIPADKKALIREGTLHMKLNMADKVFKAELHFPFTSMANLQNLYMAMNDGSLGTSKLFKGLTSKGDSAGNNSNSTMPDIGQFNGIYDFQCKDGMISRKLNAAKWKQFQSDPQFEQMKQVSGMGMEVPYTLKVSLPRPLKKIDNSLAVISDDKKTITLKYNFVEVFEHPEKFEYTIAY